MWLTLDGLAKGWAVDRAVAALRRAGVPGGWVNAGGDVRVFGAATLDVSRRRADGSLQGLGRLREAAVATSAARAAPCADLPGWLADAQGAPVAPGLWTVLARQAWRADALTKVAAASAGDQAGAAVAALGGCLLGEDGRPLPAEAARAGMAGRA